MGHPTLNSQNPREKFQVFCWPTMFSMFSGVLLKVQSEAGFSPKATGGASLPGRRPKKTEFLCFFLNEKRRLANLMKSMYAVFIWLYLQYTYTCWYPVVGFSCDNVGEYTIYGSDVSWIQDNKDDQKTCATPDIFLWKKLKRSTQTHPWNSKQPV